MPNQLQRAAGSVLKVDGVVISKITSLNVQDQLAEEDVTGIEDISGSLVQEQFISVSVGTTLEFEGILKSGEGEGTPTELEPAQTALRTKCRQGTQVVIERVLPSGKGESYTGYLQSFRLGFSGPKAVYTYSGAMRVNAIAAV